ALAVLLPGNLRHKGIDLALIVGGDALETADGDGLLLDPPPATGGLAWTVAHPAEDARKDVALPVQHVGRRVAALANPADVFGDGRMRGTRALAVDPLVEVLWIGSVGWGRPAPPSCFDVAHLHCAFLGSLATIHIIRLGCVIPTSTVVPGVICAPPRWPRRWC